jgi:outer membrane receptor protein involved in Fe transport
MRTGAVFLFSIAAGLAFGQDTTGAGSVIGRVAPPQAGIQVCAGERCAPVVAGGEFRILDLRAAVYPLRVVAGGRTVAAGEVTVRAGMETLVEVLVPRLEALEQSVTVSEPAFLAPEEVKNSGFLVAPREIFKAAGALQDVSRYVQTLPGVAIGSDDFRNDIIVRGGSPLENLFIVDNIEIPNINSFANFASAGGTVSILDPALLEDVTFLTGGYPAPFINRASSVLQVAQREGDRQQFRGRATLGFAGAGVILERPIVKEKGSILFSARRSFLDLVTDDVGFGGVPVLYSFNTKAVYDLSLRDRVWGVNITGLDRIRLGAREGNESDEEIDNFDIRYRGWRSASGVNWQRLFGARGVGLLGVTHSEARVNQSVRDLVRDSVPPPGARLDELIGASPTIFRENSREGESTIKYDLTAYLPAVDKLQAGASFKTYRIRYTAASPFGNDTPWSPVAGRNAFDISRSFPAYQTGAYLQSTRNFGRRLSLTLGGRFDNYSYIARTRFSPRAGLSLRLTEKLSWRASYGRYFQQPLFFFLAAFPQNRALTPFRANHYITGFSYVASPTLRMTLEAYRKDYKDYPVSTQIPALTLAGIGDTFNVREILFPLTSAGRGRVRGVELFIEKKFTDRWFGQANIALSRTRHAGLDGVFRSGAFDYPRVFNGVGGYRLSKKWEVSARASYLSGRPVTPFDPTLSAAQRRGVYDLTRINAIRLPDYFRLDIRADYTLTVRDNPLLLFLGVQNVINRRNLAGYTWNRRSNAQQENEQLGLFPLVGLEWRF